MHFNLFPYLCTQTNTNTMATAHGTFLDIGNEITDEVKTFLHYFAQDTTARLLHNVAKLDLRDSGALRASIQATVYNNAGGNDALVRFYYLNYGRYLQHALGAYFYVDDDLNTYRKRKLKNGTSVTIAGSGKRHGVKRQNVDVPEMTEMVKLKPNISGLPKNADRERTHYASPWLDSEIRLHTKAIQRRLSLQLGFTASAYLLHGFLRAFAVSRAPDQKTVNARMDYNDFNPNARLFPADVYAPIISFEPDFDAEEAWLKCKGYIKQMQHGWGLSSFNMNNV